MRTGLKPRYGRGRAPGSRRDGRRAGATLETADVALMGDDLTRLPAAIGSPERRASI
jgi:hypothetical protein